jgi:glutathione S-transferase
LKLHLAPRTRAIRSRWLLEELGVPYELVIVDPATHQVPTLVDGDLTLFQSSAICLYLADRFPEPRMAPPADSPARGDYYQWLLFAETTLESAVMEVYYRRQTPAELPDLLDLVDARLSDREVLAGDSFTAADIVMASLLHLANTLKLLEGHPRLVEYVYRHASRPAIRRAMTMP